MSQDPYADFAARYDLFTPRLGEYEPVVFSFYRQLFDAHSVRRVLDCACGTGVDLLLFHALGCEVHGSDISEAMLAQARVNLATLALQIPLHQADYRKLSAHYAEPFDAVLCLSSSILHMPDETQVLRAFRSMRAVLRDGGLLILTQGTSDRQWRARPRFILAVDRPEATRLFVIDYAGRGARYNIVDILRTEQGREFKVWGVNYPYMMLRDDYQALLTEAGFQAIDFYGDFAGEGYDPETSQRLIVVAQR